MVSADTRQTDYVIGYEPQARIFANRFGLGSRLGGEFFLMGVGMMVYAAAVGGICLTGLGVS